MEKNLQKIAEEIKKVHLNNDEKKLMREELMKFMQQHPILEKAQDKDQEEEETGNLSNPFGILFSRLLSAASDLTKFFKARNIAASLVVLIIFTSGGMAYGAQFATPGDLLYPVKVHVNEEVIATLKFSQEDKIAWAIRRSEKRLQEAENLETKGKLNTEEKTVLAQNLKNHLKEVDTLKASLKSKGKAQIASVFNDNFTQTLESHKGAVLELYLKPGMTITIPKEETIISSYTVTLKEDDSQVDGADPTGGAIVGSKTENASNATGTVRTPALADTTSESEEVDPAAAVTAPEAIAINSPSEKISDSPLSAESSKLQNRKSIQKITKNIINIEVPASKEKLLNENIDLMALIRSDQIQIYEEVKTDEEYSAVDQPEKSPANTSRIINQEKVKIDLDEPIPEKKTPPPQDYQPRVDSPSPDSPTVENPKSEPIKEDSPEKYDPPKSSTYNINELIYPYSGPLTPVIEKSRAHSENQ